MNWHYSRKMPAGKLLKMGVWEGGEFVGVVIFGRGANNRIGQPFKLRQTEVCELVRVALTKHRASVTRIIAIALRILKRKCPGLSLVVSYADEQREGHIGVIYQGGNWVYVGKSSPQPNVIFRGKMLHKRTASAKFGSLKGLEVGPILAKHKYLMPLTENLSAFIEPMRKPYPKAREFTPKN